jgi:cytochrome c biogenesis factor
VSAEKEWITKLVEDVQQKDERVKVLNDKAEEAMDQLRAVVEADINTLNSHLYHQGVGLAISGVLVHGFDMRSEYSNKISSVSLSVEDEELRCYPAGAVTFSLDAVVDDQGNVQYYDRKGRVSLEEISRELIAPLVRAEHGLPQD